METIAPEIDERLDRCWFAKKSSSVYHSGDLGDIIYSLLWCKHELGFVDIVLGPDKRWELRRQMDAQNFQFISPLLKSQSWIKSVKYSDSLNDCDFCLNDFRQTWFSGRRRSSRLFEAYSEHFKTGKLPEDSAWLSASPKRIPSKPVIISRSDRYQSQAFPWGIVSRNYRNRIGFIGFPSEFTNWNTRFGGAVYIQVKNALEMAEVISGAGLFIGNQSFPMSLAIALGSPLIQEVGHPNADCIFNRKNAIFYQGGQINLPAFS